MTNPPYEVSTTIPFLPEYYIARPLIHGVDAAEKARLLDRQITRQVIERYKVFEGHTEQPRFVDCTFVNCTSVDTIEIKVIAYFDDRDAAILWKLTHGGTA